MRENASRRSGLIFMALVGVQTAAFYGGFSDGVRQWVWVGGIAVLWTFHSLGRPVDRERGGPWDGPVPAWAWVLLGTATILFRLGRLVPAGAWPCGDEVLSAQGAEQLARHWDFRFFYSLGQSAPLLNWLSAAFLKAGAGQALALWLPPFLASVTFPPLAYLAARTFLPPVDSFLAAFLAATGYWPSMTGTFALQESLLLPWACLVFIALGAYRRAAHGAGRRRSAFLLGLAAGLGYWTYASWMVVALAAAAGFLLVPGNGGREGRGGDRLLAGAAFLAALSPYLWACWKEGAGYQFLSFSVFDGSWIPEKARALASLDYLNLPFWGSWSTLQSPMDVQRGGLLNPATAALVFWGLFEGVSASRARLCWAWGGVALLFLAPGFLSRDLQPFRINQFLLPVLVAAAWGLRRLAFTFKAERARWMLVVGILCLSTAWDASRMTETNGRMAAKTQAFRGAAEAVRAVSRGMGPGLLFTQFVPDPVERERALGPMLFSVNLARPRGPWMKARWGGLVVNEYYRPFLERELPEVRWIPLCKDSDVSTGRLELGLFPLLERQKSRMAGWVRAQDWLERMDFEISNIFTAARYRDVRETLLRPPADFGADRFLTAVYGEWMSDFYYRFGFRNHYGDQVSALRNALRKGVPALHLYYQLGSLYLRKRNFGEARRAFRAALREQPGNRDVLSALSLLSRMEAGKEGRVR